MECLRLEELGPDTEIGQARARLRAKAAALVDVRAQLGHLASELNECEAWLARARWGQTEPAKYAERAAERELLRQTIAAGQAGLAAALAAETAARLALAGLTRRYVDRCEELKRAQAVGGPPAAIAHLEEVIARMAANVSG